MALAVGSDTGGEGDNSVSIPALAPSPPPSAPDAPVTPEAADHEAEAADHEAQPLDSMPDAIHTTHEPAADVVLGSEDDVARKLVELTGGPARPSAGGEDTVADAVEDMAGWGDGAAERAFDELEQLPFGGEPVERVSIREALPEGEIDMATALEMVYRAPQEEVDGLLEDLMKVVAGMEEYVPAPESMMPGIYYHLTPPPGTRRKTGEAVTVTAQVVAPEGLLRRGYVAARTVSGGRIAGRGGLRMADKVPVRNGRAVVRVEAEGEMARLRLSHRQLSTDVIIA